MGKGVTRLLTPSSARRSVVGWAEWCCLVLVERPVDLLMTWPRHQRQRVRGVQQVRGRSKGKGGGDKDANATLVQRSVVGRVEWCKGGVEAKDGRDQQDRRRQPGNPVTYPHTSIDNS
jgi:hypothetical protein